MSDVAGADEAALLELATAIAREAGAGLLDAFAAGHRGVVAKSTPTDLVSEADLAAEALIRARLAAQRPDDAILGEEGGDTPGTSGLRWVADPLDGTTNFLFGLPQWCVSLAVESAPGETVAGVIYDPSRDELWAATRSGPATLDGVTLKGSTREDLTTALVATGFGYDADVRAGQGEMATRVLPQVRDLRRMGSAALDLAWVAAGRYDAYYERGVRPWDVASGRLLCERAGLATRDLDPIEPAAYGLLVAAPALLDPLYALVG